MWEKVNSTILFLSWKGKTLGLLNSMVSVYWHVSVVRFQEQGIKHIYRKTIG